MTKGKDFTVGMTSPIDSRSGIRRPILGNDNTIDDRWKLP